MRNCHNKGNLFPHLHDHGNTPQVLPLNRLAGINDNFRLALWTGERFQITLMNINPGEDIGLELHDNVDQLLYVVSGTAFAMMGEDKNLSKNRCNASAGDGIVIPAGTWHNIINTGKTPLKIFSLYAPVQHPFGTIHRTKADAEH